MSRKDGEPSASIVGSPGEALSLEGRITTPDLLAEIAVNDLSAKAPLLSSEDAKPLPQATIAVEERLRLLSGQITSTTLVRPADTRKGSGSTTLRNPADIVWRGLMLDP